MDEANETFERAWAGVDGSSAARVTAPGHLAHYANLRGQHQRILELLGRLGELFRHLSRRPEMNERLDRTGEKVWLFEGDEVG